MALLSCPLSSLTLEYLALPLAGELAPAPERWLHLSPQAAPYLGNTKKLTHLLEM